MSRFRNLVKNIFDPVSSRDRYLNQSADLADLERRLQRWDQMQASKRHNGLFY